MRLWKYLSARAIAIALTEEYDYPVSEDVVQSWKKRGEPDPRAVDRLSDLLGVDMGANRKAPRPEWAEGLVTVADLASLIDAAAKTGVLNPTARALVDAALEALALRLRAEPTPETQRS